jgi:hypothetical protein
MGYQDVRSVQKLRESLQAKIYNGTPFLQVYEIQGKPNLYDFSGLSLCLFGLETGKNEQAQTGESQFTSESESHPTGESQFTPQMNPSSPLPVNPSSPKEENLKEEKQEKEGVSLSDIWSQFLEETAMILPRSAYDTWIRPMIPTSITSTGHVEVNVPTEAVQEWLEYRLAIPIKRTLLGLLRSAGHDVEAIEIVYTIAAPEVSRPDLPDLPVLEEPARHVDSRPGKRITVTLPAPGKASKPVQPPRSKTALPSVL